jgi:aminopeptidase N
MLVTDGVYNSRSISYDVSTPNEISNMFDSISYSKVNFFRKVILIFLNGFIILKGGSVLEMVSNFLGNDTFFKGLNVFYRSLHKKIKS